MCPIWCLGIRMPQTRPGQKVNLCRLSMASLQASQELKALLQQAENGSIPAFLLFLGDGGMVSLNIFVMSSLPLCNMNCILVSLR